MYRNTSHEAVCICCCGRNRTEIRIGEYTSGENAGRLFYVIDERGRTALNPGGAGQGCFRRNSANGRALLSGNKRKTALFGRFFHASAYRTT